MKLTFLQGRRPAGYFSPDEDGGRGNTETNGGRGKNAQSRKRNLNRNGVGPENNAQKDRKKARGKGEFLVGRLRLRHYGVFSGDR